jgi:putative transposase
VDTSWRVIAKEIQRDNIHLFLTIPAAIAVADAVNILKERFTQTVGRVSGLKRRFPGRRSLVAIPLRRYDRFRERSTTWKYIEQSGHMHKRR